MVPAYTQTPRGCQIHSAPVSKSTATGLAVGRGINGRTSSSVSAKHTIAPRTSATRFVTAVGVDATEGRADHGLAASGEGGRPGLCWPRISLGTPRVRGWLRLLTHPMTGHRARRKSFPQNGHQPLPTRRRPVSHPETTRPGGRGRQRPPRAPDEGRGALLLWAHRQPRFGALRRARRGLRDSRLRRGARPVQGVSCTSAPAPPRRTCDSSRVEPKAPIGAPARTEPPIRWPPRGRPPPRRYRSCSPTARRHIKR